MIVFQEGVSFEYQTTPSIVNVQWWFDIEEETAILVGEIRSDDAEDCHGVTAGTAESSTTVCQELQSSGTSPR